MDPGNSEVPIHPLTLDVISFYRIVCKVSVVIYYSMFVLFFLPHFIGAIEDGQQLW